MLKFLSPNKMTNCEQRTCTEHSQSMSLPIAIGIKNSIDI